ncbi:hypothetical protein [Rhodovulum adriaticum]|uniref:hypothetical protein n=1 Tax=Rhodovulum adriaticum TaxID=35804 RepID=UPI001404E205|nr:hypothetical protein [Rhodovulum adriaticum]
MDKIGDHRRIPVAVGQLVYRDRAGTKARADSQSDCENCLDWHIVASECLPEKIG